MDTNTCGHDFVYGGVRYEIQEWKLPGSGAQPIHYFDWFYCKHCLENNYQKLPTESNTYGKILFDAKPRV